MTDKRQIDQIDFLLFRWNRVGNILDNPSKLARVEPRFAFAILLNKAGKIRAVTFTSETTTGLSCNRLVSFVSSVLLVFKNAFLTSMQPQAAQALFTNHTRNTIWRRIIRVCMGFSKR